MKNQQLENRFREYLSLNRAGVKIKGFLGDGTDGAVWATESDTAIKVCNYAIGYFNERDAYLRRPASGVPACLRRFDLDGLRSGVDDFFLLVPCSKAALHSPLAKRN